MDFTSSLIATVQTRLTDLDYYAGFIDGKHGPLTSAAVSAFKVAHGYAARDNPGPLTITALFGADAKSKPKPELKEGESPWLAEARSLIGTGEVPGSGNNPVIMGWARDLDQRYPDDATAWCGLFVAHCMAKGAPEEPQAFNRLGAREWAKFGQSVSPSYGAIAVFWRGSKAGWQGHVGFIVGADADTFHVLGGNQSDSVNVTRVSRSRLLDCRAPKGWSGDADLRPVTTAALSTNEA